MKSLSSPEIARLVLGYLEAEKCAQAAKLFLETSLHLQECCMVIWNRRVIDAMLYGMTLTYIMEKFCDINNAVDECFRKIAMGEQLRQSGNALEQLKFPMEETRTQRFVVNMNVPSQNAAQASNGSPALSGNVRKRRHSIIDPGRCKRTKIIPDSPWQPVSPSAQAKFFSNVESTLSESLLGEGYSMGSRKVGSPEDENMRKEENATETARTGTLLAGKDANCSAATGTKELSAD